MKSYHENAYAQYAFIEGILHITYKKGCYIDVKAAQTIVYDRLKFQQHFYCPVLCNVNNVTYMDMEAHEFMNSHGFSLVRALALLSNNTFPLYMSFFFLETSYSSIPVKLFDSQKEALLFLEHFKKQKRCL